MEAFETISKLETDLGLPDHFLEGIFRESDWSLIIKLSALIETALTQALIAEMDRAETVDFITNLNMGGSHGKLSLAAKLRLLDSPDARFIKGLLTIRNKAAHNIRSVSLDLSKHFRSVKEGDIDSFLDSMSLKRKTQLQGKAAEERLLSEPHLLLYAASVLVLARVFNPKQKIRRERMIKDLTESFIRAQLTESDEVV